MDKKLLKKFLENCFILDGFISSDAYKRSMWSVDNTISEKKSCYTLTPRSNKLLKEKQLGFNKLVMSGHEWILRQWFLRPLKRKEIEKAAKFYKNKSNLKVFPEIFELLLSSNPGSREINLPIDIDGFPGGQCFLPGIPILNCKGPGGIISFIESHLCRYFTPIIQSTKAKIIDIVAEGRFSEFGYRSDIGAGNYISLQKLLAIYIGAGSDKKVKTSCDIAKVVFPELFEDCGTTGHEYLVCTQDEKKSLHNSEFEAMYYYCLKNDVCIFPIDTISIGSGIENIIGLKDMFKDKKIYPRIDINPKLEYILECINRLNDPTVFVSGDINALEIVDLRKNILDITKKSDNLYFGLGGYFWEDVHRNTLSMVFKRCQTDKEPNMKISDGIKSNIPGIPQVRKCDSNKGFEVFDEEIEKYKLKDSLFVPLVRNGEIVYSEDLNFKKQARRCKDTWDEDTNYFKISEEIKLKEDSIINRR